MIAANLSPKAEGVKVFLNKGKTIIPPLSGRGISDLEKTISPLVPKVSPLKSLASQASDSITTNQIWSLPTMLIELKYLR